MASLVTMNKYHINRNLFIPSTFLWPSQLPEPEFQCHMLSFLSSIFRSECWWLVLLKILVELAGQHCLNITFITKKIWVILCCYGNYQIQISHGTNLKPCLSYELTESIRAWLALGYRWSGYSKVDNGLNVYTGHGTNWYFLFEFEINYIDGKLQQKADSYYKHFDSCATINRWKPHRWHNG